LARDFVALRVRRAAPALPLEEDVCVATIVGGGGDTSDAATGAVAAADAKDDEDDDAVAADAAKSADAGAAAASLASTISWAADVAFSHSFAAATFALCAQRATPVHSVRFAKSRRTQGRVRSVYYYKEQRTKCASVSQCVMAASSNFLRLVGLSV